MDSSDTNQQDNYNNNILTKRYSKTCSSCNENFVYTSDETWFDENGYGYSTKLTHCKHCGKLVVIRHMEDTGLNPNVDERFF